MTDRAKLAELIARCETFDAWGVLEQSKLIDDIHALVPEPKVVQPPDYLRSIDAALTLLPEGWASIHGWDYTDRCYRHIFMDEDGDITFKGRGRTPALALCAAALRAMMETNDD